MRYLDHHIEGSIHFMAPLTLLFAINLALFIFIIVKKSYHSTITEIIKHIGVLIFAFGIVGTIEGLFQMFDALEAMQETLPLSVISGGVKVALLNVLYGAAYFCISHAGYITIKFLGNKQVSS
jgi:flagellar motor component MotA